MKNNSREVPANDGSEKRKKSQFWKFFEKFDLREEKKIVQIGKWGIFILLVLMETVILMQMLSFPLPDEKYSVRFFVVLACTALLTLTEALKLFVVKRSQARIACFVFDMLFSTAITAATGSAYLVVLFILILTEFYMSAKRARSSIAMFAVSLPTYVAAYWVAQTIWSGMEFGYMAIISDSVGALVALVAHFFIVNFALGFYRQYLRLEKALGELAASKAELQKAYDELAEITALQERQRIAKDIHDTTGHSITTVIMQTEAAKLIIDKDPIEAKKKIIAANLQAKHALEQLRESVHLLSGDTSKGTLKAGLQGVINESTDGTGIKIRSELQDITVSAVKYRFLYNTLKESISNGLRHGGATAFWVELKQENSEIKLLVSDNGKGVDIQLLERGFGLSSMTEHAKNLGGRVELRSEEGDGFEILVVLPADQEQEKGEDYDGEKN